MDCAKQSLRPLFVACGGKSFLVSTLKGLKEGARSFRDFLFTAGYKNGRVVDSCRSLREVWDLDPVHPLDHGL
jgi:hypothetical protein